MPHLVFGAGSIGTTAESFTFTWDTPEKVAALLAELQGLGIHTLDSAAAYPPSNAWNTETLLGQSGALEKAERFVLDTKVLVQHGQAWLTAEHITASLDKSLALLRVPRVRTLYAHANDGVTPLVEQAAAFDREVRSGRCLQYGISNYAVADVTALFKVCEEHGFIKPAVYQGMYNALRREFEDDLFPLLRQHGCAFYAYSPLAGGFLTGKVTRAREEAGEKDKKEGLLRTRWQGASAFPAYVKIYDTPAMHAAVRRLQAVCEAARPPLTTQEASMRWLLHHSALGENDGVIFGAKTVEQIKANVAEMRRGPLPEEVRVVVDGMYATAKKQKRGKL
ncbi:hypothetical protein SBRCBS47491_003468 [Sporothrix bragantina]|uniref:NADP-dependent oxidoreductase domain-containing protein n=1 Tax=Sporothrix bragantina TaxID=671064 RepID=A0ABP0BGQ4_9PEZI